MSFFLIFCDIALIRNNIFFKSIAGSLGFWFGIVVFSIEGLFGVCRVIVFNVSIFRAILLE